MILYEIKLTEAEDKALSSICFSQQEWMDNAVKNRCRIATDEIVKTCVEKCLETNTSIPSSKDEMVLLAFEKGWVKTVEEINQEALNSTLTQE